MSTASALVVSPTVRRATQAVAGLGLLGLLVGMVQSPARGFASLLTNGFFFLTLGLGGAVLLALLYVTNAGWATVFKRVPEAFASYVPVGAVTILLVLAGMKHLYPWAEPGIMEKDALLRAKQAFLNTPGFAARMVVLLAVWCFFAWQLRARSLRQDKDHSVEMARGHVALSAVFLVVFALTFSLASFDWLMSLEPHWFSTIFALYNVGGLLASSVAALTMALVFLKRSGALPQVNESHLHDLGKLMFGFSTLWAYLWFSQFMLIWYANIPEESVYFVTRMHNGWAVPFFANLALNWVLPFLLLLPRPAKRNPAHLVREASLMLVGRWLDLYLMVAPGGLHHASVGPWELFGFLGVGALFLLTVTRAVESAPLIPEGDPYLVESLHHHT